MEQCLAFCTFLLAGTSAAADFTAPEPNMEVIYITSERIPTAQLETPYSVEKITGQEIRRQLYRSVPELFEQVAGVMVQKTSYGQGSPYIRGFTGFRTLMLVDGIRLNNSTFRDGPNQYWNTVDAYSISELELVRGPASALYGADAIGGTVQVFTSKLDPDLPYSDSQVDYFLRHSTAEHSNVARVSASVEGQGNALVAGATYKDFGDLTRGNDMPQPNTGYQERNADIKWATRLNSEWLMTAAAFHTRQDDVPRTHQTIYSTSFAGTTIGDELRRDLTHQRDLVYVRLSAKEPWQWVADASFTLSWHHQEETRERERTRDRFDRQGVNTHTLGLQGQFSSSWQDTRLTYGFESYLDKVDSFSTSNPIQGPVADDAQYQWHGIYLQARKPLTTRLDLLAGVRFNHMRLDADRVSDPETGVAMQLDESWSHTVGNLMFHYKLNDTKVMYAGVAQGFRAPNLSDMTRFDSARTNEFEIPATDLNSEHYNNFSLGLKGTEADFTWEVGAYYMDVRDQIQRVPTGETNEDGEFEITKKNVGDGYVKGLEAQTRYWLSGNWSASAAISYVDGKIDTFPTSAPIVEREYDSRLMPTWLRFGFQYLSSDQLWTASGDWILVDRADRLSSRDQSDTDRIPPGGTPGYGVINLRAGYQFKPELTLYIALENLLDKDYRIHGSGQNEAGRNWIVGLSGTF
ncbi:TonB-dependent receptor plug domain-containing protein [Bowmanella dokdonensis]|uniref:TonB-dependent receptor n=1 Tax=Bowmanella dokdonensis TaxID=751969 RepID=A0A939ITN5_9ALTE|nr:TonB-dependent receptor [Bowmanella dokdonensis]MBN7827641.1 TonB-dependent receptor [Bowmanella dokdonensis]